MKKLIEQESGVFTVQYLPDETEVIENPPRFSWLPTNEENGPYDLEVSTCENFSENVYRYENLKYNFFAPNHILPPGEYFWRYTLSGGEYEFSKVRKFTLEMGLPSSPMPYADERFANSDLSHPRLWLCGDRLAKFKEKLKANPSYCNFDKFINGAVARYAGKPLVKEPARYPNDIRVRPLWRQSYRDCQDVFNRIRFLAVAGVLTENQEWINEGIEVLVDLAGWDVLGSTKRSYNDEAAFRVVGALCWGYDWLYNHMNEEQKAKVLQALVIRTKEVVTHVFYDSKIQYALFDSHAVRSVSSVLIPCGIVLYGDHEEAADWVNCAVDYANVLYTPWGGKDGGWAEGGMYWTTGLAFLIDALNLLKNFTGIDIFKRPFFQKTGDFPLYCWPHDAYRTSFGDQSNIGEKPILKTGFNARALAGNTGSQTSGWYCDKIAQRSDYYDGLFYNSGWWDFYFDEVLYLSEEKEIVSKPPKGGRNCRYFSDIGWVAMHKDMDDEENHVFLLTKSSKYGSVSHSHGDQNAIMMFAYGDPLLVEGGYYVSFDSDMHKWRRSTISKNCLLFDGRGQYGLNDKIKQLNATGEVQIYEECEKYVYVKENATKAYGENVPELRDFTREIYWVDNKYYVIIDSVELSEELDVSFLLHSMYKPEFEGDKYALRGKKANLDVQLIHVSAGICDLQLTDEFPDVKEEEYAGLEKQWHYTMKTGKAKSHKIVSCYYPSKVDEEYDFACGKTEACGKVFLKFICDGEEFECEA